MNKPHKTKVIYRKTQVKKKEKPYEPFTIKFNGETLFQMNSFQTVQMAAPVNVSARLGSSPTTHIGSTQLLFPPDLEAEVAFKEEDYNKVMKVLNKAGMWEINLPDKSVLVGKGWLNSIGYNNIGITYGLFFASIVIRWLEGQPTIRQLR